MNYKLDVELSEELEPYRSEIEATIKPYIKIELTDNNKPIWWQSKFGGFPYMPKDFDYPKNNDGEYLYLLAQINFAEVPKIEGLPEKGILQFYIGTDDLYGCNFDSPTVQENFRVVYFPDVSLEEKDLITNFEFLIPVEEDYSPIQGFCAISFRINYAPISASDYQFNFFEISDDDDKFDEYWDTFYSAGHKILGYPCFTQEDPRIDSSEDEPYILLFQIDSDSNENGCDILWGDNGIANFFIKQSDLAKLNFSEVIYNWDCS